MSRRGGSGVELGGDASPFISPGCVAVDAPASLARWIGASVALGGVAIQPRVFDRTNEKARLDNPLKRCYHNPATVCPQEQNIQYSCGHIPSN